MVADSGIMPEVVFAIRFEIATLNLTLRVHVPKQ